MWAFEEYVLKVSFNLKPLVPLLTTTELSKTPPGIVRFLFRVMRYSPKILHVPGKHNISVYTLLRVPACTVKPSNIQLTLGELHNRTSSCNSSTPTREQKSSDERWGMYVNHKKLWRRLATVHDPTVPTTCILGKQITLGNIQRSPVWWTNCTPTNSAIRCVRLHPSKPSRHYVMSCESSNVYLVARAICIHWRYDQKNASRVQK